MGNRGDENVGPRQRNEEKRWLERKQAGEKGG